MITAPIAVTLLETEARSLAEEVAAFLNCPIVDADDPRFPSRLCISTSEIAIQINALSKKPYIVDFTTGKTGYRRRQQAHSQEFIAKAVGIKRTHIPYVLDATAGFGRDGVLLAGFGCHVILLEKNPIVYLLLSDGLMRLQRIEPALNIQCFHAEATEWLKQQPADQAPDVIYLDPMYPTRRKTAAVKKEMQILQYLLGHSSEDSMKSLLDLARRVAKQRVVVKRPVWATPLAEQSPDEQIFRKTTRYDLYFS